MTNFYLKSCIQGIERSVKPVPKMFVALVVVGDRIVLEESVSTTYNFGSCCPGRVHNQIELLDSACAGF